MLSDTPPDQERTWSDERMQGAWRFLNRLWDTVQETREIIVGAGALSPAELDDAARSLRRLVHESIRKVTEAIEGGFRFNTAVASVMELLNGVRSPGRAHPAVLREAVETMLILLAPITPHFCEELWSLLGHGDSIFSAAWPAVDEAALVVETLEIPVQVNGKLRGRITVPVGSDSGFIQQAALSDEKVAPWLEGRKVRQAIVVPGRLVNIVLS
jgi:leucyl-tRNA synthetase